jgi:hypothetical protein
MIMIHYKKKVGEKKQKSSFIYNLISNGIMQSIIVIYPL